MTYFPFRDCLIGEQIVVCVIKFTPCLTMKNEIRYLIESYSIEELPSLISVQILDVVAHSDPRKILPLGKNDRRFL